MRTRNAHLNQQCRLGFTLLELIVAMVVLTIAMSVAFQAFSSTIRGWKRGTEVIDGINHGDFAMDQLASAINSTIYFYTPKKSYAFTFEKEISFGFPADTITFVTASSAFMPENSPLKYGPHRIKLYIDKDDYDNPALFASAFPAIGNIKKYESEYDSEPYLISRSIQGLEILIWDKEIGDWIEKWEKENSIPERVKIMIYVASKEKIEDPIVFTRMIDIPVAQSVKAKLSSPTTTKHNNNP